MREHSQLLELVSAESNGICFLLKNMIPDPLLLLLGSPMKGASYGPYVIGLQQVECILIVMAFQCFGRAFPSQNPGLVHI